MDEGSMRFPVTNVNTGASFQMQAEQRFAHYKKSGVPTRGRRYLGAGSVMNTKATNGGDGGNDECNSSASRCASSSTPQSSHGGSENVRIAPVD
ncbi:hypothetical protein PM082_015121 [Marasmius tenuissimus]|nr:hypothetical protein PM082_024520 [Marasmius tenuissimus]KAJ8091403.1 hypothetical protein PM082_015121 [Marasmius tenuissimus]